MEIANLEITNPVFLAPMAGVTDFPYRQIVRQMGCQLLFTEMISSKGLLYNNQRTIDLIKYKKGEKGAIAIQLFGEEVEAMVQAAVFLQKKFQPDLIDINMGCPTRKIVKNGAGSALMRTPKLAAKIVKEMVAAVNIPITVKMRTGWDQNSLNVVSLASLLEEAGAQAITVHARTREQFYQGQANWLLIKEVKREVNIPVIGNGDIFSPQAAQKMIEETACDGVMIGRGAQGNPWLIKRTIHYLKTGELLSKPSQKEKISMALFHLKKAIDYYGLERGILLMRKHLAWYLKGLPNSSIIKEKINKSKNYQQLKLILKTYLKDLE